MARPVYIKKGPGGWVAVALAVCAALGWLVWQACRLASRYRARTAAASAVLVSLAVIGTHATLVLASAAAVALAIWWLYRPASFAVPRPVPVRPSERSPVRRSPCANADRMVAPAGGLPCPR